MLTQVEIERLPSFAIGFKRGEARGKAEGKAEGKSEGRAQIVRHLLHRLDVTKTSELLGLPPEEVEQILASGDDRAP